MQRLQRVATCNIASDALPELRGLILPSVHTHAIDLHQHDYGVLVYKMNTWGGLPTLLIRVESPAVLYSGRL